MGSRYIPLIYPGIYSRGKYLPTPALSSDNLIGRRVDRNDDNTNSGLVILLMGVGAIFGIDRLLKHLADGEAICGKPSSQGPIKHKIASCKSGTFIIGILRLAHMTLPGVCSSEA